MGTYDINNMAMANAAKLISVRDWVKCEGRLCYVQDISNVLGFNQYFIVDIDSGVVLKRSRFQLEPADVKPITLPLDDTAFAIETVQTEDSQDTKVNLKPVQKRFLDVSSEELNCIELNRTSVRTWKQTAWAVSIMKGQSPAMPPSPCFCPFKMSTKPGCFIWLKK